MCVHAPKNCTVPIWHGIRLQIAYKKTTLSCAQRQLCRRFKLMKKKEKRKNNVHEKKANERKKCARQAKHFGITNTEQKFSENARLLFLMLRLLSLVFEGNKDCFHDAE